MAGLFRGFTATAIRDAPYAGLYVLFYEESKMVAGASGCRHRYAQPHALRLSPTFACSPSRQAAVDEARCRHPADRHPQRVGHRGGDTRNTIYRASRLHQGASGLTRERDLGCRRLTLRPLLLALQTKMQVLPAEHQTFRSSARTIFRVRPLPLLLCPSHRAHPDTFLHRLRPLPAGTRLPRLLLWRLAPDRPQGRLVGDRLVRLRGPAAGLPGTDRAPTQRPGVVKRSHVNISQSERSWRAGGQALLRVG
jgi:hypothetical protein